MSSYSNTFLRKVFWGPACLERTLPEALGLVSSSKKAVVITGKSLATKTDVIRRVESALGDAHAETFSHIGQHAPIADIRKVVKSLQEHKADVLIAVGGGSPIDSAKAIAYNIFQEAKQSQPNENADERDFIPIIAIPTTLSVAETTQNAGFTNDEGQKTSISHPALVPRVIIYDAELTTSTPEKLWLSTGMRAVDHAVETLYRPGDSSLQFSHALGAIRELFHLLPASKREPNNLHLRQRLQLACFNGLWPESRRGSLGLSHGLGHALGATYSIPHGITSCLTLPGTIAIMSQSPTTSVDRLLALSDALNFIPPTFYAPSDSHAQAGATTTTIAAAAPSLAQPPSSLLAATMLNPEIQDANNEEAVRVARAHGLLVSQAVQALIEELGLHSTLKQYDVPPSDFTKIAQHATRGKDATLEQLIVEMLKAKYDDAPSSSSGSKSGGAKAGQL